MAILIGVIALAVIPNIQRSRESKDLSQLDSIASAANAAIATNQISSDTDVTVDVFNLTNGVAEQSVTDGSNKLLKTIYDSLAAGAGSVNSSAAKEGKFITLTYNTKSGAAKVKVVIASASKGTTGVSTGYTSEPDKFEVQN